MKSQRRAIRGPPQPTQKRPGGPYCMKTGAFSHRGWRNFQIFGNFQSANRPHQEQKNHHHFGIVGPRFRQSGHQQTHKPKENPQRRRVRSRNPPQAAAHDPQKPKKNGQTGKPSFHSHLKIHVVGFFPNFPRLVGPPTQFFRGHRKVFSPNTKPRVISNAFNGFEPKSHTSSVRLVGLRIGEAHHPLFYGGTESNHQNPG